MSIKFEKLTPAQRNAIGRIALGDDSGLHPRTAAALTGRGLIERYAVDAGDGLSVRYSMPLDVHMAWCAWCAKKGRWHGALGRPKGRQK